MSGDSSAMTGEPKTAEEALALHKELLERENALLSENAELWEDVYKRQPLAVFLPCAVWRVLKKNMLKHPRQVNREAPVSYTHLDVYKRQEPITSPLLKSISVGMVSMPKRSMSCGSCLLYTSRCV